MAKSGSKLIYVLAISLIVIVAGGAFHYLEWEAPQVLLDGEMEMICARQDISVTLTDMKSGIRSYRVALLQGDKEYPIVQEDLPLKGTFEKKLTFEITPAKLGIRDGKAQLMVHAVDFSPLKNSFSISKEVTIDSVPPQVGLLSTAHYVTPGGTCLVLYTASDDAVTSGVLCGGRLFPGVSVKIGQAACYLSYVAVPMDMNSNTPVVVMARDKASNESMAEVSLYVRGRAFRKDEVKVGDSFVNGKSSQFKMKDPSLADKTPVEVFAYLNETLREENNRKIAAICASTDDTQLWKGAFLRMKNAATMALFGDRRTYVYQGKAIGESIHRGIDLASVRQAPVQAANTGRVLFAGDLGIYGNTVIIDHGQGLASLYAHLSVIKVQEGQDVEKGKVIASSGATGFAGGDHLHFSMMIHGVFVDPVEWWDAHWIQDNVSLKLEKIKGS